MHPSDCRCAKCLVDRSSFGTPEAKAARESVTDEQVARVVTRVKELELREAVAGVLGRVRPPEDHSPNCTDAELCRYCLGLAAALLPLIREREAAAWDAGAARGGWRHIVADCSNQPGQCIGPKRWDWLRSIRCALTGHHWQVNQRATQRSCPRCWMIQDRRPIPPDECHHPFIPGVSTDHAPGESDPRWCNTCGEACILPRARWQVRHVESGVTVPCLDQVEAEAHVRESASGPWVAEHVIPPGAPCPTCVHPEGYDRLSGPCPTCHGTGVTPPAQTTEAPDA